MALFSGLNNALINSSDTVYKNLVDVRKKLKDEGNVRKLREQGNLKILLSLLGKPNMKIIDVSLSILGNCCLDKDIRDEILKLNGVSPIVTILKGLETPSIQNRACRTLANLAIDRKISTVIHKAHAIPAIVNFLHSTGDPLCQQTAARALRILADTPEHKKEIIAQEGARTIAELLVSDDEALLKCLLKTMLHFTQTCTHKCAEQVLAGKGVESLVNLCGHKKDSIRHASVLVLVNLMHEPSIRPVMGSVGVVSVFIIESNRYIECKAKSCGTAPAFALCLCSLEAVNRKRIKENGGLKTFILLLSKTENERNLHEKIVDSILNFIFDNESLKELIETGLVLALVRKLSEYLAQRTNEHQMEWKFVGKEKFEDIFLKPSSKKQDQSDPTKEEKYGQKNPRKLMKRSLMKKDMYRSFQCAYEPPDMCYPRNYGYHLNEEMNMSFRNSISDSWDSSHRTRNPRLPKSPAAASPEWIIPEPSPSYYREEYYYYMRSRRSPRSWSPMSTSPAMSPSSRNPCYSPVCHEFSEEEDEEDKNEEDKNKTEVDEQNWRVIPEVKDYEIDQDTREKLTMEIEQLVTKNPSPLGTVPYNCNSTDRWWWDNDREQPYINKILILLARFSQMEKLTAILLSPSFITTLLNVLTLNSRTCYRSERIIQNLSGLQQAFEPFVLMHFPEQMSMFLDFPLHPCKEITDCKACISFSHLATKAVNSLSMQASTTYGQSTIQELMKKSVPSEASSAVLMIPYLYHDKEYLHKLYLELDGLKILLTILCNPNHSFFITAIKSYLKLCSTIYYWGNEKDHERDFEQNLLHKEECLKNKESSSGIQNYCIYQADNQPKDVTFILDNGDTVHANRMVLSKNCDVFEAMLQGGFSEATSDKVKFGHASSIALNYVIHFLHGCSYTRNSMESVSKYHSVSKTISIKPFCPVHSCTIDGLLEVLFLADRLLLPVLQDYVFDELVKKSNTAENANHIFDHAMVSGAEPLARAVLNEICCPRNELRTQLSFFECQLKLKYSGLICDQMEEIITKRLRSSPYAAFSSIGSFNDSFKKK